MHKKELQIKNRNIFRRKARSRAKVFGTKQRPRISVNPTLSGFKVQFIDDENGVTILSGTDKGFTGTKTARAKSLGESMAGQARKEGISKGIFDKGSKKFHGRIKAFINALKDGGLKL